MRKLLTGLILLLCAAGARAQNSAVTATITDSDSQTWNNGTYSISFVPSPSNSSPPIFNGSPMTAAQLGPYTGSLSGSGVLTVTLPDNAFITPPGNKWQFTLCSNTSAPCSSVTTTVTGASPNLSTTLSNGVTAPRFPALGSISRGYADAEVTPTPQQGQTYYNVTSGNVRLWNGSAWINSGGAGGGTVTGSGVANQVAFWTGASAIGGNANFTWTPSTQSLVVSGLATSSTSITADVGGLQILGSGVGNSVTLNGSNTSGGTASVIADGQATLVSNSGVAAVVGTTDVQIESGSGSSPLDIITKNLNMTHLTGELDLGTGATGFGGVLGLNGPTSGKCTLTANATGTSLASSCPITGTGGADTALDNLAAVAINTALLPGTTNTIALGSAADIWSNVFAAQLTSAADGVHAGLVSLVGNTTAPTIVANTFNLIGPSTATFTAYGLQFPSTAPSGTQYLGCGTPSSGVSTCSFSTPSSTPSFPVTVAGTVTSGGIPYFSSTTVESSSAILNTNLLVKGGGAGAAPTNSLCTDNGTTLNCSDSGGITGTQFNLTSTSGLLPSGGTNVVIEAAGSNTLKVDANTVYSQGGSAALELGGSNDLFLSRNTATVLAVGNAAQTPNGTVEAAQLVSVGGTACANANFALSAGWGSTASVSGTPHGFSQTCEITISSAGTGQATGATVTWTLPTALPTATTVCTGNLVGGTITGLTGTGILMDQTTLSATAPVFTFAGLPVATTTTKFAFRCGP